MVPQDCLVWIHRFHLQAVKVSDWIDLRFIKACGAGTKAAAAAGFGDVWQGKEIKMWRTKGTVSQGCSLVLCLWVHKDEFKLHPHHLIFWHFYDFAVLTCHFLLHPKQISTNKLKAWRCANCFRSEFQSLALKMQKTQTEHNQTRLGPKHVGAFKHVKEPSEEI